MDVCQQAGAKDVIFGYGKFVIGRTGANEFWSGPQTVIGTEAEAVKQWPASTAVTVNLSSGQTRSGVGEGTRGERPVDPSKAAVTVTLAVLLPRMVPPVTVFSWSVPEPTLKVS